MGLTTSVFEPGLMITFFFFSTTTAFERPPANECLTEPLPEELRDNGLRAICFLSFVSVIFIFQTVSPLILPLMRFF